MNKENLLTSLKRVGKTPAIRIGFATLVILGSTYKSNSPNESGITSGSALETSPTNSSIVESPPVSIPEIKLESNLFDQLLTPFIEEAKKLREGRAENEPEFSQKVDLELNKERVNLLFLGCGETHEPPVTEKAEICSITIASINTTSREIHLVSLTHDIRAPEIERFEGKIGNPVKIDKAYKVGGFPLMRETIENATGLSIDFQFVFSDAVLKELVDQVFGEIEISIPIEFDVHPIYFKGEKYPVRHFESGRQSLDGLAILQFIKAVPIESKDKYNKLLEHNNRKHFFLSALSNSFAENATKPTFWLKTLNFLRGDLFETEAKADFDTRSLIFKNILKIFLAIRKFLAGDFQITFPEVKDAIYIVDEGSGDGGVSWARAEAARNPVVQEEIKRGVYQDLAMEVPEGGDPYAEDLVTGYWQAVRSLVKKTFAN